MSDAAKTIGTWRDQLCWCPSQCYLTLSYLNKNYEIYLRWRWEDPWSAELKCDDVYIKLNVGFFKDKQLEDLKIAAIKEAKRILYSKEHLLPLHHVKPTHTETPTQRKVKEREKKIKKIFNE